MGIAVLSGCKRLLTDLALVGLVSCVLPDVPPEVVRIHKGGTTHLTFVRPITSVDAVYVVFQKSLSHKRSLAQLAVVVLFTVVCGLDVCEQVAPLSESGTTYLTLEWLFPSVGEEV